MNTHLGRQVYSIKQLLIKIKLNVTVHAEIKHSRKKWNVVANLLLTHRKQYGSWSLHRSLEPQNIRLGCNHASKAAIARDHGSQERVLHTLNLCHDYHGALKSGDTAISYLV